MQPTWSFFRRALAAVAVCLLQAGCSLVPAYRRPAEPPAAAWNTAWAPSDAAVAAKGAWWRYFASPELDRLMRQALGGSLTLQSAVARVQEARGIAEIDSAPLFPFVSLAGLVDHANGVKNTATQQGLVQASYELDFWGRNRALSASGGALAQASAFDADTVAMTVSASLVNTYFQILSLDERIRLARRIADDARHVLGLITVQREAGTATDLQVQQQRAALATFDAAVPALQQQAEQATHLLAVLAGLAPEGFGLDAHDLSALARPEVLPVLPSVLLQRRPDIRAAEARLISANFDVGAARAAFFPTITLNAALGIGARDLTRFFPASAVTDVGGSLLQPLFEGGQLSGQLRYNRARKVELVATYRQTVLAAFQDVEDALSALVHTRDQEAIEIVAQTAASKAAGLAELQYRLGSADYLSVLTTEQTLYQTQDTLLQLRLLRLQSIVGLFRALDGGFDSADLVRMAEGARSPDASNGLIGG